MQLSSLSLSLTRWDGHSGPGYWLGLLDSGGGVDLGAAIAVDANANVIFAGRGASSGAKTLVAKLTPTASVAWARLYDPGPFGSGLLVSPGDLTISLALDSSGNPHIVGTDANTTQPIQTTKYDAAGAITWQKSTKGAGGWDRGYRVAVAGNGNIYAAGMFNGQVYGGDHAAVVKYNSSGVRQWITAIQTSYLDAVALDASENVYVATAAANNGYVAKLNSSGVVQWANEIAVTAFYCVATDASGNVYCVGESGGQAVLISYTSTGAYRWGQTLGTTGNYFQAVAVGSGYVYCVGSTTEQGAGATDILIAKYTTAGLLQWQRVLGHGGHDYGMDVALKGTEFYFTGRAQQGNTAGARYAVVGKFPVSGAGTGTIGSAVYAVSTLASATWSPTITGSAIASAQTSAPVDATTTYADAPASFTTNTISRF